MIRAFIMLTIVGLAAANAINEVAPDVRELLPKEVFDFLSGLTTADTTVIEDIRKKYAYKPENEALAALKKKSPELGTKVEKLHNYFIHKINALGGEAKIFAKEVIAGVRKYQSDIASGNKPNSNEQVKKSEAAVQKFLALSDAAKADLKKQFPKLTSVSDETPPKVLVEYRTQIPIPLSDFERVKDFEENFIKYGTKTFKEIKDGLEPVDSGPVEPVDLIL